MPIVAVANAELPLCEKPLVTLEDVAKEELVLTESQAPYSVAFEREMAAHHLTNTPVIRLESAAAAARLVSLAPFVSVLPLYAIKKEAEQGALRVLPIPEWSHTQRVQAVLHCGKAMTPQIQGLLTEVTAVLGAIL